jgi:hypothetical protein
MAMIGLHSWYDDTDMTYEEQLADEKRQRKLHLLARKREARELKQWSKKQEARWNKVTSFPIKELESKRAK